MSRTHTSGGGADRAVSEVIGYVLVVSLVMATIGIVSVSGLSALQNARQAQQVDNAERAMDLLADNMEDIYRQGAPSRSTEIRLGTAQVFAANQTHIKINGTQPDGDSFSHNVSVWTLTYEGDSGTQLVYDTGAVFRDQRQGGLALRPLPFVIGPERTVILIPRTNTGGTSAVSGSTVLVRASRRGDTVLENDTSGGASYSDLEITVTSPHSDVWEETLSEREHVSDCVSAGPNTVSCDILSGSSPDYFYLTTVDIQVELVR